jgi:predicted lipase
MITFNPNRAYYLAKCCAAAYGTITELANFIDPPNITVLDGHGVLLGETANEVIIAFRGSDSPEDWFEDFKAYQVKVDGLPGMVEQGFYDCWSELLNTINDWFITSSVRLNKPIWITGHSLGGAVATIASFILRERTYPIAGIYTFGSPAVGDETFSKAMPEQCRVINQGDIVPDLLLPPMWLHTPSLTWLDEGHPYTQENWYGIFRRWWARKGFEDHGIEQYLSNLQTLQTT